MQLILLMGMLSEEDVPPLVEFDAWEAIKLGGCARFGKESGAGRLVELEDSIVCVRGGGCQTEGLGKKGKGGRGVDGRWKNGRCLVSSL